MKRLVALIIAVVLLLSACADITAEWQEQIELGYKYLSSGNYEEAVLAFTRAIEIDPKNPVGYFLRGTTYTQIAQEMLANGEDEDSIREIAKKAEEDFDDAYDHDDNQELNFNDSLDDLADIYDGLGDEEEADRIRDKKEEMEDRKPTTFPTNPEPATVPEETTDVEEEPTVPPTTEPESTIVPTQPVTQPTVPTVPTEPNPNEGYDCNANRHKWVGASCGLCGTPRICWMDGHDFDDERQCSVCGFQASCTNYGHVYLDGGKTCTYCGHVASCATDWHRYDENGKCVFCAEQYNCVTNNYHYHIDYETGKCTLCGQRIDCEASGQHYYTYTTGKCRVCGKAYNCAEEGYHLYNLRTMKCVACGHAYSCAADDHYFVDNGFGIQCYVCGLRFDCAAMGYHWNVNYVCRACGKRADCIANGYHIWESNYRCGVCGAQGSCTEDGHQYSFNGSGSSNGICRMCGHKHDCAIDGCVYFENKSTCVFCGESVNCDGNFHRYFLQPNCVVCGHRLVCSEEGHQYNLNGVCLGCGAVFNCTEEGYHYRFINNTCVVCYTHGSCTADGHSFDANYLCGRCGYIYNCVTEGAHAAPRNGVCAACGETWTCSGHTYANGRCKNCDIVWDCATLGHVGTDICAACGQSMTCSDTGGHSFMEEIAMNIWNFKTSHRWVCSKCHRYFSCEAVGQHDYDNGINCIICGQGYSCEADGHRYNRTTSICSVCGQSAICAVTGHQYALKEDTVGESVKIYSWQCILCRNVFGCTDAGKHNYDSATYKCKVCGDQGSCAENGHLAFTDVPATVSVNCAPGNIAHKKCTVCGQKVKASDTSVLLTDAEVLTPGNGAHTYLDSGVCSVCGNVWAYCGPNRPGYVAIEHLRPVNGKCTVCGEDWICGVGQTPHWTVHDGVHNVCEACGEVFHTLDENIKCLDCGKQFSCAELGHHSYNDSLICIHCNLPKCAETGEHNYVNNACAICNRKKCAITGIHDYVNGICTICSAPECAVTGNHNYVLAGDGKQRCSMCDALKPYDYAWSGWMTEAEYQAFAPNAVDVETRTEYSYRTKEVSEWTSDYSKPGWEFLQSTTMPTAWSEWSPWQDNSVTAGVNCEVRSNDQVLVSGGYKEYRYGRWQRDSENNSYCYARFNQGGVEPTAYYTAWSTTRFYQVGDWTCGNLSLDGRPHIHEGVAYFENGKPYWHLYSADGSETKAGRYFWEQSRDVAPVYKTQYSYRTRTDQTMYQYYRWSSWSSWSTVSVSASDMRNVQTRTIYHVKYEVQ